MIEISIGQGLILYTLFVIIFTIGCVEAVRTIRKTRRIMKTMNEEVDK